MGQPLHIVIWDSDASNRCQGTTALENLALAFHPIRVSNATGFQAALAVNPDLCLIQLQALDVDAAQVLDWAGKTSPPTPVIFLAENLEGDAVLRLWRQGAFALVCNGDHAALVDAIHRATQHRLQQRVTQDAVQLCRRFRTTIGGTAMIFFEWNLEDDSVTFEGDVEGIIGVAAEQINGHLPRFFDFVHPDDREYLRQRLEQARSNANPCRNTYRVVRPDGSIRHVESTGFLIDEGESSKRLRVGFIRDITTLLQAQDELRESRQLLQTVLDNIPIGVFWKNRESRYLGCNQRVADAFGFRSPQEMVGKCDLEFPCLKREEAEYFLRKDREVMETNESEVGIVEPATFANGRKVWLETSKVPLRSPSGEVIGVLGIWQDITEKRHLEERMRERAKMEAIGRLAGGVAHDFNNLLTVINGYTDLLLGQTSPEDVRHDALTQIRKAGLRASGLTRQLLAFSRKTVLLPAIIDLNDLIWDIEKLLHPLLGEGIVLQVDTAPQLWPVKVDPTEMTQVILNLCANARDAMPNGGILRIQTANVNLGEDHTALFAEARSGPHVCLTVSDSGVGMDVSVLSHIFEPFFTTKGPDKGTGLGLATVYGIVQQSGGHIDVKSEVGKGTTFRVYFPRATAEPLRRRSSHGEHRPAPKGQETVLLVEDEDGVRKLARMVLEGSGYRVVEAANGSEALRISPDVLRSIDLLVTDVMMPSMSGPQLAREILSLRPDLRVLYLSGYTDNEILHYGVSTQDHAFLHKPFTPTHLTRKVREVLDV
jgi:PAS domain S-box-containing protein